jgi:hypothetical protein
LDSYFEGLNSKRIAVSEAFLPMIVWFVLVMPVPDQVRDDGSGIQKHNTLIKQWIPGQARNDKNSDMVRFANCNTVTLRVVESTASGRKKIPLGPGPMQP